MAQATALMMFATYFGRSVFVSLGKTILLSRLVTALHEFSPTLNAQDLLFAGATGVREAVSEGGVAWCSPSFQSSVNATFELNPAGYMQKLTGQHLAAAVSAVGYFTSWGLGWKSVKKKKAGEIEQ